MNQYSQLTLPFKRSNSIQIRDIQNKNLQISRRQSCYCNECGKRSSFQVLNEHVHSLKEIQYQKMLKIQRNMSLSSYTKTQVPSEISQFESENGKIIKFSHRSVSTIYKKQQESLSIDIIILRKKSCECTDCGQLSKFQKKHQHLARISNRQQKNKNLIIKSHRKLIKQQSKEFQLTPKSIISSPISQKSIQLIMINSSRRTKDINKLISNKISTRDLDQLIKPININSCKQLDLPIINSSKSQKLISLHKPTFSFGNQNYSKSYRLRKETSIKRK